MNSRMHSESVPCHLSIVKLHNRFLLTWPSSEGTPTDWPPKSMLLPNGVNFISGEYSRILAFLYRIQRLERFAKAFSHEIDEKVPESVDDSPLLVPEQSCPAWQAGPVLRIFPDLIRGKQRSTRELFYSLSGWMYRKQRAY